MANINEAVQSAIQGLVEAREIDGTTFVNLPLVYPDGSFVTLQVGGIKGKGREAGNKFRISDNGYAYRELECIGAERSFANIVTKVAEEDGLSRNKRAIFVDVPLDQLQRAICDVAVASWRVADTAYQKLSEDDEGDIDDELRERLKRIFGEKKILEDKKIQGISSTKWEFSAIVQTGASLVIFDAVGNHPNSIYRASTSFHDIGALENPPRRVAVVRDKQALGSRLHILSQAGKVIDTNQPDDVFVKAAA